MDNITEINTSGSTNVEWYQTGEKISNTNMNRPIKDIAEKVNELISNNNEFEGEVQSIVESYDYMGQVEDFMYDIRSEIPELSIPFMNSGKLDYGIGTEYVTDLPIYSVNFERVNPSSIINRTGVVETKLADEIAIDSKGAWLHKNYTNYVEYSHELYNKTPTNATLVLNSDESPFGTDSSTFMEDSTIGEHYVDLTTLTPSLSYINGSVFVKAGVDPSSRDFSLKFYGGTVINVIFSVDSDGSITTDSEYGQVEYAHDGWYRCSIHYTVTDQESTTGFRFHSLVDSDTSFEGNEYSTFFITGAQLTESIMCLPLVETDESTANSGDTTCTLPVSGNMPKTGKSWTIVFDSNTRDVSEQNRTIFSIIDETTSTTTFNDILFLASGNVSVRYGNGSSTTISGGLDLEENFNDGDINRFAIVYDYDNGTIQFFVNGQPGLNGAVTVGELQMPYDGNINFGSIAGTWFWNSTIKNFKWHHYAASDAEILSWGSPK